MGVQISPWAHRMSKKILVIIMFVAAILCSSYFFVHKKITSAQTIGTSNNLVAYSGPVRHVFFHSLIIYPDLANADTKNAAGYAANMITVDQFKTIIAQLYANNFVLINTQDLYSVDQNGNMKQDLLYLPLGKKPLILSVDDLNYYSYMKSGGFANKLVLDNGIVKTQVITPEGNTIVTDDGDVVPIVDEFVKEHPDFSINGAKGIIGVTGFEGILGYRTELSSTKGTAERVAVLPVIAALKNSGWVFASHSYTHDQVFLHDTIGATQLASDISNWNNQVEPLVGKTNIFIGPFGEIFKEGDPRRQQLINAGFNVLYGVGMDGYMKFFSNHFVMNRIDIDGYRLTHDATKLNKLFGLTVN